MNKQKMIQVVQKQMPEFRDEIESLSVDQLDARLAQHAKDLEAVEESKEQDEGLASAREAAKQANAPYVEAKKAIRLKSSYVVHVIKERGGK